MRALFILFFIFSSCDIFSQQLSPHTKVEADSGKNEFLLQAGKDTSDYRQAYRILTNQVNLNPSNAEYRYYLGYTIDRLNADDGKSMYLLNKEMTLKASEQFESVNELEPIFKGELFLLDPYSKLTGIWGSLAESYLNRKLPDSAKWAFKEGKKRGGFLDPVLAFNRQLLNSCDSDAILITYGDNITISIWYLQTVENYRNDITVVDANLINTIWYPKYLKSQRNLKISFSDAVIDTIDYQPWITKQVSVVGPNNNNQKFSWELRPTYLDNYILKGDKILLNIIQENFYTRPFYFNNNSDSTYNLFLTPYLSDDGLVNRLMPKKVNLEKDKFTTSPNLSGYNIDKLETDDIIKSREAIIVLNGYRWAYFNTISSLAVSGNFDKAKELIKLMTEKFPKSKLPFTSADAENYISYYLHQVEEN